jgi:uncharacterized membrane protein
MTMLIAAVAAFLAIHFLISGTPVRATLVKTIGEAPYLGLFSVVSIATLVWMIFAFIQARASPQNTVFWGIGHANRDPAIVLTLLGFLLAVPGLLTNSPTRVRGGSQVAGGYAARGMMRVTRNPFLWGVALWSLGHLIANGRLADLILFGGLFITAIGGPISIDAKRVREQGEAYRVFMRETSNIPFAAILARKQPFRIGEIWWRLIVAVVLWAALIWLHPYFTGRYPLG